MIFSPRQNVGALVDMMQIYPLTLRKIFVAERLSDSKIGLHTTARKEAEPRR